MLDKAKKAIDDNQNFLVIMILEAVIGILLLINPTQFTTIIFVLFGIFLIAIAIRSTYRYFKAAPEDAMRSQGLTAGIVALIAGVFCIAFSDAIVSAFPVITTMYGIVILLAAAPKIQWSVDALRLHNSMWYLPLIDALVAIVCGAIVISGQFNSDVMWKFIAISLLVIAVFDIVCSILIRRARLSTQRGKTEAPSASASSAPASPASADSSSEAPAASAPAQASTAASAGQTSTADAGAASTSADEGDSHASGSSAAADSTAGK
jgi:uncharacterized membrane protein HdeD (DUF308 family)